MIKINSISDGLRSVASFAESFYMLITEPKGEKNHHQKNSRDCPFQGRNYTSERKKIQKTLCTLIFHGKQHK